MKIETNLIFDDRDLELLSKPIPLNPCGYCSMGSGCCGCPEHSKYVHVTEEYQERGILKYAEDLKTVSTYKEQIEKIQDKIDDILYGLPEQVKKICEEQ